MTFKTGLIVGKFCPLHRGHQFLIETALDQCETVVVLSYAKPEIADYDRSKRAGWLLSLYPQVKSLVVDDSWLAEQADQAAMPLPFKGVPDDSDAEELHRRFCAWLCYDILGETPEVMFTSESYGDGFAEVLSAYFSERRGQNRLVQHICVDQARRRVPISGTLVRADARHYQEFIDPRVYATLASQSSILVSRSDAQVSISPPKLRQPPVPKE